MQHIKHSWRSCSIHYQPALAELKQALRTSSKHTASSCPAFHPQWMKRMRCCLADSAFFSCQVVIPRPLRLFGLHSCAAELACHLLPRSCESARLSQQQFHPCPKPQNVFQWLPRCIKPSQLFQPREAHIQHPPPSSSSCSQHQC